MSSVSAKDVGDGDSTAAGAGAGASAREGDASGGGATNATVGSHTADVGTTAAATTASPATTTARVAGGAEAPDVPYGLGPAAAGHVLGNFHTYYRFNPAAARMEQVPHWVWDAVARSSADAHYRGSGAEAADRCVLSVLDVGCNEGDLTLAVQDALVRALDATGGDTDGTLGSGTLALAADSAAGAGVPTDGDSGETAGAPAGRRRRVDSGGVSTGGDGATSSGGGDGRGERSGTGGGDTDAADDRMAGAPVEAGSGARLPPAPAAQIPQAVAVMGVDVDSELIERANAKSAERNRDAVTADDNGDGDDGATPWRTRCAFVAGDMLTPETASAARAQLAHWCHCASVGRAQDGPARASPVFDLVTCFSVTMWVHLNHGDDGLRRFVRLAGSLARNVIVEPQPWKCYRSARRRCKRLGVALPKHADALSLRDDNVAREIDRILREECGFAAGVEVGGTAWGRSLLFYQGRAP